MEFPLLTLCIWLPIIGGLIVLASGNTNPTLTRWLAFIVSLLSFFMTLPLWSGFDNQLIGMQFVEKAAWIPAFSINYYLGVDGFSMPLIILTAFITILVIISAWEVIVVKPAQYLAAFLIMEGLMIGVFSALDAMLFYVYWEAMLIPMFLIIGVWGGPNRVYATIKFFIYTFFGSVFMLVALIYMHLKSGSMDILVFHQLDLSRTEQIFIFIAFFLAFAVKVPMWPVHTWLPDAHVEAPTGGSVILAAIMLKIGGYGFIRFSLPITPDASHELAWMVITLSLIAVVYIGFVALVQTDMKKLIAYSSISHMGFVTLAFFIVFAMITPENSATDGALLALSGAMVQMVSHGFISAAMFLVVGVLYDRMHTREIAAYGGVINKMPWFAAFAVFFAMANAGLPATSGFVGEFMIILSAFQAKFIYAFLAATTLIIGAAYTLWMVKRVIFGDVTNPQVEALSDINRREFLILAILAGAVLLLGLYPAPLVEVMDTSIKHLLEHLAVSKY